MRRITASPTCPPSLRWASRRMHTSSETWVKSISDTEAPHSAANSASSWTTFARRLVSSQMTSTPLRSNASTAARWAPGALLPRPRLAGPAAMQHLAQLVAVDPHRPRLRLGPGGFPRPGQPAGYGQRRHDPILHAGIVGGRDIVIGRDQVLVHAT